MPHDIQICDIELPADEQSQQRVWRVIGWSDSERSDRAMLRVFAECSSSVGLINDEVECAVPTQPCTMRLDRQGLLPLMRCTVNILSSLFWGVCCASSLAISDGIVAA